MFGDKDKKAAKQIAEKLNALSQPDPTNLDPVLGPITRDLIRKQAGLLGQVATLNREISELDAEIAWFKRNPVAEQYFPKVAAILDSLRTKEEKTNV
jgi:hypothetical protein